MYTPSQALEISDLLFSFLPNQLTVETKSGCAWTQVPAPPFLVLTGKLAVCASSKALTRGLWPRTFLHLSTGSINTCEERKHNNSAPSLEDRQTGRHYCLGAKGGPNELSL